MIQLSEKQSEIVKFPIGNAIQVIATAGTGKTRVLTERIRYILTQTKKDKVIALTFTNRAAEEMQNRLADISEFQDRVWIATIHSVAQQILEKYGHLIGLPKDLHIYENDNDRMEMFIQSLRDSGIDVDEYLNKANPKEKKQKEQNLKDYMAIFSKIKRENLIESDFDVSKHGAIFKIYQDYQQALLDSNGIDYDDIIIYAQQVLLQNLGVARNYRIQYKHLFVDEAQDLNKAQYNFIKILCGEDIKSILMVGDPDQMIYGFTSSSSKFLCENFIEDFTPTVFRLQDNYRCTKAVVAIANTLKPNKQQVMGYALEGKVCINEYASEEEEALGIVNKIKNLLLEKSNAEIEGDISLDKMVIIVRTKFGLHKIALCLQENNLPYFYKKSDRNSENMTGFDRVLDYAINIKLNSKNWIDAQKLSSIVEIPIEKKSDFYLSDFIDNLCDDDIKSIIVKELLKSINDLDIQAPNIPKLVKLVKDDLKQLLDNTIDVNTSEINEYIATTFQELDNLNQKWTIFKRKGLGNSLSTFRNAISLGKLNDDGNEEGIPLSTVHTMKGLEKDIVFLAGMCEGMFPHYLANTNEKLEEERNNAFVAITRARRWLFISYPKTKIMPWGDKRNQRKSRFLDNMDSINC